MKIICHLLLVFCSFSLYGQDHFRFNTIDLDQSESADPQNLFITIDNIYLFGNYKHWRYNFVEKKYYRLFEGLNSESDYKMIHVTPNNIYFTNNYTRKLYQYTSGNMTEVLSDMHIKKELAQNSEQKYIVYDYQNNTYVALLDDSGFTTLFSMDNEDTYIDLELYNNQFVVQYKNKVSIIERTSLVEQSFDLAYPLMSSAYNAKTEIYNNKLYLHLRDDAYQIVHQTLDLQNHQFSNITLPVYEYGSMINVGDYAVLLASNKVYKIKPDNSWDEIILQEGFFVYNSIYQVINGKLYLDLTPNFQGSPIIAEVDVENNTIRHLNTSNNVSVRNVLFTSNSFYYTLQEKLYHYDLQTNQVAVLSPNLKTEAILGMYQNEILLNASMPETGYELYSYNTNNAEVKFYGEINTLPNVNPRSFYNVGDKVFFQGQDGLYVSQGAIDNSYKVNKTFELSLNNYTMGGLLEAIDFKNKLFFRGAKNSQSGSELWYSDGTDEGTQEIEINPHNVGPYDSVSGILKFIAKAENRFYFLGQIGEYGEELWSSDGTKDGTQLVIDFSPGSEGTFYITSQNAVYGDKLYFMVNMWPDDYNKVKTELWSTEGTLATTQKITNIVVDNSRDSFNSEEILFVDDQYIIYKFYDNVVSQDGNLHSVWKMNLQTLEKELLISNLLIHPEVKYLSGYIYYQDDNDVYRYNIANKTTENLFSIANSYNKDFDLLQDCGNYLLFGSKNYYGGVNNLIYINKTTNQAFDIKKEFLTFNFKASNCINNKVLLGHYIDFDKDYRTGFLTIENDQVKQLTFSIDDNEVLTDKNVSEVIYNPILKKLFMNNNQKDFEFSELTIADVSDDFMNTIDPNFNANSKKGNVILYPNPAHDEFNIYSKEAKILHVNIYSLAGTKLRTYDNLNISNLNIKTTNLKSGLYLVEILTTNGKQTKKIILK